MALDITSPAEALSEAGTLFAGLITGLPSLPDFPEPPEVDIPEIGTLPTDLTEEIAVLKVSDLTSGAVGGDGIFDKVMATVSAHIESQYKAGILGQSQVAEVYIAAIQTVLPQSLQFMLSSQNAYWGTKLLQIQAQNAYLERVRLNVEIVTARLNAFRAQADAYASQVGALTAQTQFANGKMQLVATLQQINMSEAQQATAEAQYTQAHLQFSDTLPTGGAPGGHASRDFDLKEEQLALLEKQQLLLDAQTNVQRAQTYDTNTDTTAVAGVIGTQKALYEQQIDSYQQDGKSKGVKLIADIWTSAKALDDAVESPGPIAGNLMMAMNAYMNGLGLPNAMVSADTPASGAPSSDTDWDEPGRQV